MTAVIVFILMIQYADEPLKCEPWCTPDRYTPASAVQIYHDLEQCKNAAATAMKQSLAQAYCQPMEDSK